MSVIKHGVFLIAELGLRYCISPHLRARLLRILGATIGANVRVYECRFINLSDGFRNLSLGNNVHIGNDCLIDLKGRVAIGDSTTLSPRVMLMSHSDPGSYHDSLIVGRYPPETNGTVVGESCWIGAGATLLSGTRIGSQVVVGAMALVRGELSDGGLYVGVPVRRVTGSARLS